MAQDQPTGTGGNKPKPGGSTPKGGTTPKPGGSTSKPASGQSAKDRSRAQSRPVTGKATPPKGANKPRPPATGTKGGNKPRPGRPVATTAKPPSRVSGALIAWGAVGLVIIVIAVFVVVKVTSGTTSPSADKPVPVTPAPASLVSQVTSVPASVFDKVGVDIPSQATPNVPIQLTGQPALTLDGKTPAMFYFGAEYCPFCAAERWGMVIALSRFGTWSNLDITASSPTDYAPNTPTWSFRNATFSSPYLSFFPVENCTNIADASASGCDGYSTLQQPTSEEQAVLDKYSSPTYIPGDTAAAGSVSFPFIDVGNKVLYSGATYSPLMLAGLTHSDIASGLTDTSNSVTQSIIGTANYLTASICQATGQMPTDVCSSAGVQAAAKSIKSNAGSS
jgi:hypothetical protein